MTIFRPAMLFSLLCLAATPGQPADERILELERTIELPAVKGRIDHFGVDAKRGRLYIAALGNDTVEVVDLKAGRRERSLRGFGEPQDVLHVPEFNRVYVANGSADRIDILDGGTLAPVKHIGALADADNVRYDAATHRVYVGYGKGALRVLDAATGNTVSDIALSGHPESFQLEKNGSRIFVNVPRAGHVAVVDRIKGAVAATWPLPGAAENFPMALDETGRRLFVGTRSPALLLAYDIDSGKVVARMEIGKDTDDIFFDPVGKRVYVICGEGRIDIVRQVDPDHYALQSTVATAPRARTGLFVPEEGMLYVAAPAAGTSPARVLAYRVR